MEFKVAECLKCKNSTNLTYKEWQKIIELLKSTENVFVCVCVREKIQQIQQKSFLNIC